MKTEEEARELLRELEPLLLEESTFFSGHPQAWVYVEEDSILFWEEDDLMWMLELPPELLERLQPVRTLQKLRGESTSRRLVEISETEAKFVEHPPGIQYLKFLSYRDKIQPQLPMPFDNSLSFEGHPIFITVSKEGSFLKVTADNFGMKIAQVPAVRQNQGGT